MSVDWTMAMKTAPERLGLVSNLTDPVMAFMVRRMLSKFGRLVETTKVRAK